MREDDAGPDHDRRRAAKPPDLATEHHHLEPANGVKEQARALLADPDQEGELKRRVEKQPRQPEQRRPLGRLDHAAAVEGGPVVGPDRAARSRGRCVVSLIGRALARAHRVAPGPGTRTKAAPASGRCSGSSGAGDRDPRERAHARRRGPRAARCPASSAWSRYCSAQYQRSGLDPGARVLIWQVDVVDVHDHARRELRDHLAEEVDDVAADPHRVRAVDEEDVAGAELAVVLRREALGGNGEDRVEAVDAAPPSRDWRKGRSSSAPTHGRRRGWRAPPSR